MLKQNRVVKEMIKNVTDPVQLFQYKNSKVKVINLEEESIGSSSDGEKEKELKIRKPNP